MADGFGVVNNDKLESLFVFNGSLYAGLNNSITGLEVWQSNDGSTWSQINPDGFGDSNSNGTLFSNGTVIFKDGLYLGVNNGANGLEIWQRTANIDVNVGGINQGNYNIAVHGSLRKSYLGLNNGPVEITSVNNDLLIAAQRLLYYASGVPTSFVEMMGLPAGQLDTTYWFPWYKNVGDGIDTQPILGTSVGHLPACTCTLGELK